MSSAPLTFLEEIALLALDDTTGARRAMPVLAFNYAIAGALLADLALADRIDTDPKQLVVLRPEPLGDPVLDEALATLAAAPAPQPVSHWLSWYAERSHALEEAAFARLVARGILRREDKKILWVFGVRRYPTIDNQERTEVRTRLAALIRGDDLPDPRDAVLIGLLTASHLIYSLFPEPDLVTRSARLATLARMDLVGREVAAAIDEVTLAIKQSIPHGL